MDFDPKLTADMDQMIARLRDMDQEVLTDFTEATRSFIEALSGGRIAPIDLSGFILGHVVAIIYAMQAVSEQDPE